MEEGKVQTVLNWPEPTNLKALRSFLGVANFYRRFILKFSAIAKPLNDLVRVGIAFVFTPEARAAFNELKLRFTTAPILAHFDPSLPTHLETDASDYALGAMISQTHKDGLTHPVAFDSRKLAAAELNYEIHDKELLAIVWALHKWRHYFLSVDTPFEVYTDHDALKYFMSSKILTRRQARWAEYLADFDFTILYRPGKANIVPDALSRRDDVYPPGGGWRLRHQQSSKLQNHSPSIGSYGDFDHFDSSPEGLGPLGKDQVCSSHRPEAHQLHRTSSASIHPFARRPPALRRTRLCTRRLQPLYLNTPISTRQSSRRTSRKNEDSPAPPPRLLLAFDDRLRHEVRFDLQLLRSQQVSKAQEVRPPPTTPDPEAAMGFAFYGSHRSTTTVGRLRRNLRCRRPTHQNGHLHPNHYDVYRRRLSGRLRTTRFLEARTSRRHRLRSRFKVRLELLELPFGTPRYCSEPLYRLPPTIRRPNRTR